MENHLLSTLVCTPHPPPTLPTLPTSPPTPHPPQTKAAGKCSSPYVQQGGYCRSTCGACRAGGKAGVEATPCTDVPTPDGVTCMVRRCVRW